MSLRDALLKSGAVSNKQLKRTERQLRTQRKTKQSKKEKAKVMAERRRAKQEATRAQAQESLLAERIELARLEARAARGLRLVHLIQGGHLRISGGPARFYFVGRDGSTVQRLWLPWSIAHGLRSGSHAIAVWEQAHQEAEYVVLPREIALRVKAIHPESLRFFNEQQPDLQDPALGLIDDGVGPDQRDSCKRS